MFDLERSINTWLRAFRKHRAFNHGSIREMELHLRDNIDDLIGKGHSEEEAFNQAVRDFGEIPPMATEEYFVLMPESKSFLNMIILNNYLKIAFRNFWRHKFYSLVNLMGLTIGLAVVILIGLFVIDELSFDKFHIKKDQLYRVVENQYYSGQPVFPVAVTPTALGPSLKDEYPEIVDFTRVVGQADIFELGEKKFMESDGAAVDQNFFDIFSFRLISGSKESFASQLNSLIINEDLAAKYFEGSDPIGQSIRLNDGEEYIITGVIENFPKNSHISYAYLKNFEKYLSEDEERRNQWGSNWLYTYVELDQNANLEEVNEKIIGQIKKNNENSVTDIYLQPLTNIYLGEVDFTVEVSRKGEMQYVRIFTVVAFFILLISCINFMNLSTARSVKRSKEVGLRKTVGASRGHLVSQFLGESVLLTTTAVILAIILVILLLPQFNQITNKEFELGPLLNLQIGLYLFTGILAISFFTGLLAGSYPAAILSSMKPTQVLKPGLVKTGKGAWFRQVLVTFQFVISVVLIIGTLVVYNQLNFIQNKSLGYDRENIIYLFPPADDFVSFANELREDPNIIDVGASNRHPAYVLSSTSGFQWKGKDPESTVLIHYMGVDENYMRTMKMEMASGRTFTFTDTLGIIINEKALELMGLEEPLGEIVTTGPQELTIIGVVKDFHFKSIHTPIEPLIMYTTTDLNRLYIKVPGEKTNEALGAIDNKWSKFYPNDEFEYNFLDEDFEELYRAEDRTRKLSTYFAALAIFISCLGLFGLVSFATEQRTKEIGIRKVMGASTSTLFVILTTDFTKLVILSLFIAIPIGWLAMDRWLESFAYHIDMSAGVFVISGLVALLIAVLTVSYRSIKASISNPINALRNE